MKKLWLIGGLLCCMSIWARTPEQAACVASEFLSSKNTPAVRRMQQAEKAATVTAPVEIAYTQMQVDNEPAVYVFNGEDGFVLVSAEDDARAILGYSDHGRFDATDMPANMQFWLQMYADELASKPTSTPSLKGRVQRRIAAQTQATYPTIIPILGEVEWGQDEPYNNLCPTAGGERSVTGCVATAISQIMYAHKYPTKGTGSKTYTTESHGLQLNVNFGATTYDWGNMLPYYKNNYNSTQANAVATLMYHVGVAADMDYAPDGSGAISSAALANMGTYFGYDKGIQTLPKDYMKEEEILNAIVADLEIGHPVYVSGATKNKEGHAFVCDGIKSDGYLHINWGWDGVSNGYFALSALDPDQQGTGGSASDMAFTEGVEVFAGIQPNKGGKATPLVTVKSLTLTSGTEISRNAKVAVSLDGFTSVGIATAAGTLGYYIYDTNDNLIKTVPIGTFDLPTGYGYTEPIAVSASIPGSLANGSYEMEVGYTDDAGTIRPILVKGKGVVRTPMTVTSSSITFGEGSGSGGGTVELAAITSIDVTNVDQSNVWSIDLYSSYFWSDYESDNEVLIRLTLNSGSETSVVGSYVLDGQNSGAVGTINTGGVYAIGYHDACYPYNIDDMHLTITDAGNGALRVEYWVKANGTEIKNDIKIAQPDWYLLDSSTDQYYFFSEYITYELASTIPASRALAMTKTLSHTDVTDMSYFVSGIISNMRNTPEQIVQYKSARFDISDDGTTANQFYCYNTKWLDNTAFVTGNEVALGDEVVIYGQVQNYMGNTPEIKGYVYNHSTPKNYEITNLQVRTEGSSVYFSFESDAPNFHVKITDQNGASIVNTIIDFKQAKLSDLADGTYTLWIRPVDEAQEYYIGDAVEEQFEINTTATGIEDLEIQQTVVLYDLLGRLVDSKQSGDNRPFDVPADGVYIQRMGEKTTTIYINKR